MSRRRYARKTVHYGPHRANLADIWMRPDLPRDGKAPVLLQVPGGAWMIGMRRPQSYPLMSHLAEQGWICVSIGYRISPRHPWPNHIIDVKQALGLGEGQHRRIRRRPRRGVHHRRFGRWAPDRIGRARRPTIPSGSPVSRTPTRRWPPRYRCTAATTGSAPRAPDGPSSSQILERLIVKLPLAAHGSGVPGRLTDHAGTP